jgi:hypothetical protein
MLSRNDPLVWPRVIKYRNQLMAQFKHEGKFPTELELAPEEWQAFSDEVLKYLTEYGGVFNEPGERAVHCALDSGLKHFLFMGIPVTMRP